MSREKFPLALTPARLAFFYCDLGFDKGEVASLTGWERSAIDRVSRQNKLKRYGGIYRKLSDRLAQTIASRLHGEKLDWTLMVSSGAPLVLRRRVRYGVVDWRELDALIADLPQLVEQKGP